MLKIENLHASVAGKQILKGLSLELKPGQVHAIMGPNGAGKSTLGNILAGREGYEVTEGRVTLDGIDLLGLEPERPSRSMPSRDENQLHAAVVELVALEDAEIKYSTVQNWYPGDENGVGGIYNFVTKRGECRGARSKISWTQVETGSAITWKYPSCVLRGDNSVGEFYSVALTHHRQQADTGTKMIHLGRNTKSKIISKGISAGRGQNTYRGLVKVEKTAAGARNYTQCDSLLIGKQCGAHTFPYMEVKNPSAIVEHEATTSKISDDQMFYCRARGIPEEDAVSMIVDGFCKQVFRELPMEFAVEAKKLLEVSLEGAVG